MSFQNHNVLKWPLWTPSSIGIIPFIKYSIPSWEMFCFLLKSYHYMVTEKKSYASNYAVMANSGLGFRVLGQNKAPAVNVHDSDIIYADGKLLKIQCKPPVDDVGWGYECGAAAPPPSCGRDSRGRPICRQLLDVTAHPCSDFAERCSRLASMAWESCSSCPTLPRCRPRQAPLRMRPPRSFSSSRSSQRGWRPRCCKWRTSRTSTPATPVRPRAPRRPTSMWRWCRISSRGGTCWSGIGWCTICCRMSFSMAVCTLCLSTRRPQPRLLPNPSA